MSIHEFWPALAFVVVPALAAFAFGYRCGRHDRCWKGQITHEDDQVRAMRPEDMDNQQPVSVGDLARSDTVRIGRDDGMPDSSGAREVLSAEEAEAEAEADQYIADLRGTEQAPPRPEPRFQSWSAGGLHYIADMVARDQALADREMAEFKHDALAWDEFLAGHPWAWEARI